MAESGIWHELKRRHIYRVAAAYVVVGWLIIQVVAIIFPLLQIPDWLSRVIVVLVLAGFPLALVLAWAFDAPHSESPVSASRRRRSLRIGIALGLAGALLAVIVDGVWSWMLPSSHLARTHPAATMPKQVDASSAPPAPAPINPKSIAVLPLGVVGPPGNEYLGQGISDELLNALSRINGLEVIGRASSFRFKNRNLDAREIGRQLGVRNLLSGDVQRSGDDLRIDVELDDTVTGAKLWSNQYDEKMEGLFALEDRISTAVVAALQVKLGGIDAQQLVFEGTDNAQAHDLYMQALRLSWRTDEASLQQALILFGQAIAEDPNYAAAWAGVARTYVYLADVYRAPLSVLPSMRGAAQKSIALNPELAEGHLQLGYILMSYDLDYPAARKELELAVRLRPSLAEAHAVLGLFRMRVDRDIAAGRRELQVAEKLDPLNPWYPRWEAYAVIAQGDERAAMELATRIDQLDPAFAYNGDAVAMVLGAFGHWQACVDRYTMEHARMSQSSPQLAICLAHTGDATQARATVQRLAADAQQHYVDRTYIAAIQAALGDGDGAMENLEQAMWDRSSHMPSLWMNPWYRPLHEDPRYQALIARIRQGAGAEPVAAGSSAR